MSKYTVPRHRKITVLERDGWACRYCGVPLAKDEELIHVEHPDGWHQITPKGMEFPTLDHVIPRSKGGNHKIDNLAACCMSCNSRKATRSLEEWQQTESWHKRGPHGWTP